MPNAATPTVQCLPLGPFQTNTYIVRPTSGAKACWVIDPSFGSSAVVDAIRADGLLPQAVVLTHAHIDHIAGVADVRRAFPEVPILVHRLEEAWLNDPVLNLSAMMGQWVTAPAATGTLQEGAAITLDGDAWDILYTPGHSPGGVTLVHRASNTAIVGDSLFAGSIGRTDFPGSDHEQLLRSIREKLYALPDETVIYPGHGPRSTIGREKRSNPFVRE